MNDLVLLLANLNLGRRLFQSKVMKGVKPLLLMPETNALSERLYSKLTRIKTYHRSNVNHNRSTSTEKFYTAWIFFFCLGFLSRTFTIHRTAGEEGGYLFNSSLPLPPVSQALRHWLRDYCREFTCICLI